MQIEQGEFTEMAWQAFRAAIDVARDISDEGFVGVKEWACSPNFCPGGS